MERIAIFGGSFNPIHNGHVRVALRAAAEQGFDRVLVTPAKTSPFKTDGATAFFTDEERWRMVVAACAERPPLVACDVELRRGGVSYSIDTVRAVRAAHPGDEIFFIVGEDAAAGLPRWRDADELRRLAKFVTFPRTMESSTEIRRRIAAGEAWDDLVPEPVGRIIREIEEARRGR